MRCGRGLTCARKCCTHRHSLCHHRVFNQQPRLYHRHLQRCHHYCSPRRRPRIEQSALGRHRPRHPQRVLAVEGGRCRCRCCSTYTACCTQPCTCIRNSASFLTQAHVHTHILSCAHTQPFTNTRIYTFTHTYLCTRTHTYTYTRTLTSFTSLPQAHEGLVGDQMLSAPGGYNVRACCCHTATAHCIYTIAHTTLHTTRVLSLRFTLEAGAAAAARRLRRPHQAASRCDSSFYICEQRWKRGDQRRPCSVPARLDFIPY